MEVPLKNRVLNLCITHRHQFHLALHFNFRFGHIQSVTLSQALSNLSIRKAFINDTFHPTLGCCTNYFTHLG